MPLSPFARLAAPKTSLLGDSRSSRASPSPDTLCSVACRFRATPNQSQCSAQCSCCPRLQMATAKKHPGSAFATRAACRLGSRSCRTPYSWLRQFCPTIGHRQRWRTVRYFRGTLAATQAQDAVADQSIHAGARLVRRRSRSLPFPAKAIQPQVHHWLVHRHQSRPV